MRARDPKTGRFVKLSELRESATAEVEGTVVIEEGIGGLREASRPGRVVVDLITPGWGSSGYYSEAMLRNDAPSAFPSGTHMYLDHPTLSDETERPERSVKDLAAVTVEDARWDADRKAMSAEATLFPDHRDAIKAKATAIGVSIRAAGHMEEGEAEGKSGNIITSLDEGISADFVTKAGRGGKIAEILEGATETDPAPEPAPAGEQENVVEIDEKELSELRERLGQLETNVTSLTEERDNEKQRADRAEDAQRLAEARRVVSEALDAEPAEGEAPLPDLPERAIERVKESALKGDVPVTDDGKIDTDKLIERARKAARDEAEYLGVASEAGKVTGFGARVEEGSTGSSNDDLPELTEDQKKKLEESLTRLGSSEQAAKIAAEGR